jgi:hypothetical protein
MEIVRDARRRRAPPFINFLLLSPPRATCPEQQQTFVDWGWLLMVRVRTKPYYPMGYA